MREIEVDIPVNASLDQTEEVIEAACAAEGLRLTMKYTLKAYPGCVHWHYKSGTEAGTLEITLWAAKRRIWFKVSAGRQGDWIEGMIERIKRHTEETLN